MDHVTLRSPLGSTLISFQQGQQKPPRLVFNLAQKISCGYALILSVLVIGVVSGFMMGERQRQQAVVQEKQALTELRMLHRLQVALLDLNNQQQQIGFNSAPTQFQYHYSALLEGTAETEQAWRSLKKYVESADYRQADHREGIIPFQERYSAALSSHLQQLQTLMRQVDFQGSPTQSQQFKNQIAQLITPSPHSLSSSLTHPSPSQSSASLIHPSTLNLDSMTRDLAHVIRFSYDDFQRTEILLESAEALRMRIAVGSLVGAVAIASILAWLMNRAITRPIKAVTRVAQQVIQTENFRMQAAVTTQDEVGVLASTLNDLIGRVQLLLQEQQDEAAYQLSQVEQQLIESKKMSSMGQMIAGIAVELSNPVNFILGNLVHAQTTTQHLLDILALYIQETPVPSSQLQYQVEMLDWDFVQQDLPKIFRSIQTGADRVSQITMSLKDLSQVATDEKCHLVDVHACLDNALLILRSRLKRRIHVVRQYGRIPKVEGYYSALYQVFTNILSNSIEALERAIDCGQVMSQEQSGSLGEKHLAQITVTTEYLESNYVLIRIGDNGIGIPQADQPQVFQSFFTTKPINMGVGLGLTISQQIVQDKHGGQLMFSSEPGKGTTFSMHLPISQKSRKSRS